MMNKNFLFVCGIGRSGTTELARVLSAHSEIVLGVERYKRLWRPERIRQLTPERFNRDRFFDFSDGLTNITPDNFPQWKAHYEVMDAKFDTASYVGDKMTQLRVHEMKAAFPAAKFIIIVRNVFDVAFSWDQRAKRPGDRWPETHDARQAVIEWNKGLQRLADYVDLFGSEIAYVEYEAFFSDPRRRELERLLSYLGLAVDPRIARRFFMAHNVYNERIAQKDRSLAPEVTEFIAQNADLPLWNHLCPNGGRAKLPAGLREMGLANESK